MRICIVGHIASEHVAHLLNPQDANALPTGYTGAPLMGLLIEALLERGHEVIGITTDGKLTGEVPLRFRHGAFQFIVVPARPRSFMPHGRKLGRAMDMFRQERHMLAQEIVAARPDIVHAHWTYEFAWAAIQTKLPHLITVHDAPFKIAMHSKTLYRWVRAAMAWYVLRKTEHCTAVSPYMAKEIQPWVKTAVRVVPNPIANLAFSLYREPRLEPRRIAMVCNGWGPHKNAKAALIGFSKAKLKFPDLQLWIWGQDFGPKESAEKWAVTEKIASGVTFFGAVSHDSLLRNLAGADVFLHPSLEESFGVVVAEAMALGLPVIGGENSGAVPWLIGDSGLLVDIRNSDEISKSIIGLVESDADMCRLSVAANARAKELFGLNCAADAYFSEYSSVLSS